MDQYNKSILCTEETWEFLDLIYETSHDPGFWPLALEGLKAELDLLSTVASESLLGNEHPITKHSKQYKTNIDCPHELIPNLTSNPSEKTDSQICHDEMALIAKLRPHFKRAFELNQRYQSLKDENELVISLLDRIPLGIIFTDNNGKVISQNSFASALIKTETVLTIKDDYIKVFKQQDSQRLLSLIHKAHDISDKKINSEIKSIQLQKIDSHSPISILVTPHVLSNSLSGNKHCVVLFIVADDTECVINENAIASLYSLSTTEALIAKHIASGKTLAQYCDTHNVTLHTVRSQLKSIFHKTSTHSQSELSNRVLTSPALFISQQQSKNNKNTDIQNAITDKKEKNNYFPDNKQIILLPDGRSLCYVDVGDKHGIPIVLCHGSYGCRKERFPDDRIATEIGIRLIIPDRPGFGLSTFMNFQHGLEWCQDFKFLIEHLSIAKTHIMSTGSGSYFALACAHEMPERLTGLTLVNSIAPFATVKEFSGMIPHEKLFYAMARHTPTLFKRFAELCYLGLSKNTDWYLKSVKSYGGYQGSVELSDKSFSKFIKDKVFSAYENSVQGAIQETILLTKPWKIDLTTITTQTEIYHGGKQVAIPSSMSQRLNSTIPNSKFHYYPEQGNYLLYVKWASLLNSISSQNKNIC